MINRENLQVYKNKCNSQGGTKEYEEQLLVREELREALSKERGGVSDEDGIGRIQNSPVQ